MSTSTIRVAIVEVEPAQPPLQLPPGANAEVTLRIDLTPEGFGHLAASGVQVAVLDFRQTCTTRMRSIMRLLRIAARSIRLVAVTDPGDHAAAQVCIATGAVAHLGRGQTALSLLRAVNAASRNAPCMGETGKRAVCRMRADEDR